MWNNCGTAVHVPRLCRFSCVQEKLGRRVHGGMGGESEGGVAVVGEEKRIGAKS